MVDEGTSVSGKRLGSIVRSDVAQISLTWNYLTTEEWKAINVLFSGPQYSNKVDFFDQITGTIRTGIEMCVSDRSAGMWRCNVQGDVLGWLGCSLQLTEV
ncbi:MAG: hypothetical protein DBX47_07375 [Clostridiales bacterium]|nr:MAG: hypothetical protein DBX47_07375 [Clostridiales bacterium]